MAYCLYTAACTGDKTGSEGGERGEVFVKRGVKELLSAF